MTKQQNGSQKLINKKQQAACSPNANRSYTHGNRTAKAVVMFHGVTACPAQFADLAQYFYDKGYNVYVPLTPHHGLPDGREHSKVTAKELVDYVTESVNITSGLGDERGVAGLSGGGMLATWAAEYRPGPDVKHLLVLSPFYEPATAKAPKWQLPFLAVLYGKHILPDKFIEPATPTDAAFSYYALANYKIVMKNLRADNVANGLTTIGIITSEGDDQIDLPLAQSLPGALANKNQLELLSYSIPKDWNIGHNVVDPSDSNVAAHQAFLFDLYFNFYEGRGGQH